MARTYFRRFDAAPSAQALSDACATIEGFAAEKPPRTLHLRVAGHGDKVFIDMADQRDRAIEIGGGTWRLVCSEELARMARTAPIPMFRRTELTAAMPDPVPAGTGDVDLLWKHVNVAPEDRPVLLAAMVAALVQPDAPHVILTFLAEHGSAKSTTVKRVVALIDPSVAPLRMPPRDVEQWVAAANGSWVIAIDNASSVSPWWSDALCRAATGDALAKRRLYTDSDLAVLRFRRVVLLNGIDLGGLAGDLSDRLALVELNRITAGTRRSEADLDPAWERDHRAIFGGLLDLAAKVHQRLGGTVTVPGGLPRMADFGRALAVVDEIVGTDGLAHYQGRAVRLAADGLAADPFISEIVATKFRADGLNSREILQALTPDHDKAWRRPRDWPSSARVVTAQLTRNAPALRLQGWLVEHDAGRNRDGVTRWDITPPEEAGKCDPPNPPNPSSQVSGEKTGGSDAGQRVRRGPGGPGTGYESFPDPPKNGALTSENGSAGYAGQDFRPSLAAQPCAFCGQPMLAPASLARGHCERCHLAGAANAEPGGRR
ncbi:ATP-binding protein [Mycobacterium shinjukuense]|uniref:ATP-binding protein n=1 Tax=Mycobacterium shinjukuense TaxID=398694 RepID=UPI001B80C612|nr:ATP-binding protein [Mycobacterium shinjukuense]MCV6987086.1 ATP-binding protein [Mycobacterium shinjukuense]